MNGTLSKLACALVAGGALLAAACGGDGGGITGGGGGGGGSSGGDRDPTIVAKMYLLTVIRVYTGQAKGEDIMRLFEDSCRSQFSVADVQKGLEQEANDYPKLKGVKLEDFDFQGKAKVDKTSDGATVTVPPVDEIRVKIDGKWLNAFEYFKGVGLADDGDKGDPTEVDVILRNGRYYLADCDDLEGIAEQGRPATPTPQRNTPTRTTPTPPRGTPTVASRTPTTGTGTVVRTSPTPPRGTSTPASIGR
jgi:hypothetical protein